MIRRVLITAYLWAPFVALLVLIGFALGWWLPAIFAAVFAVVLGSAVFYRRLRRLRADPGAPQAQEERAPQRVDAWSKILALLLAGLMILLVVVALVVVVVRHV